MCKKEKNKRKGKGKAKKVESDSPEELRLQDEDLESAVSFDSGGSAESATHLRTKLAELIEYFGAERVRTLVQSWGAKDLVRLHRFAGWDCKQLPNVDRLCERVFGYDLDEMGRWIDVLGIDQLLDADPSELKKMIKLGYRSVLAKEMKEKGAATLEAPDFAEKISEMVAMFESEPSPKLLEKLLEARLLVIKDLLTIEDTGGGSASGASGIVARYRTTLESWVVELRFTIPSTLDSCDLNAASLCRGALQLPMDPGWCLKYVSQRELLKRWLESRDTPTGKLTSLDVRDFKAIRDLKSGGKIAVYVANVDKVTAAEFGGLCFSFSCPLAGALINYVLHVHCKAVDEDLTDFEILRGAFKLKSEEMATSSSNTIEVLAGESTIKGLGHLRSPVLGLIASKRHAVLRELGVLLEDARSEKRKHAEHYERHNVAAPEFDLEGWTSSLKKDRVYYLFKTEGGLKGHQIAIQGEVDRFNKYVAELQSALEKGEDPEIRKRLELCRRCFRDLDSALQKAASKSASNGPDWEDFHFYIEIDFGSFGLVRLKR